LQEELFPAAVAVLTRNLSLNASMESSQYYASGEREHGSAASAL
jgi:hypothetical protein